MNVKRLGIRDMFSRLRSPICAHTVLGANISWHVAGTTFITAFKNRNICRVTNHQFRCYEKIPHTGGVGGGGRRRLPLGSLRKGVTLDRYRVALTRARFGGSPDV